ncbi:hypothetical protein CFIMG_001962RA [Ceratocystis fimbriata CBS 114723]|uniref:Uncharacterized protein n=1 Tax=Ceratocystis fimbriata CBS 114723 TaxID=1035309 RepID=A0A2C5X2I1_9PEZI|nr:hypothetical protein CFIMG_001962RA [Ceratocystis fimbriata CBS 114723]
MRTSTSNDSNPRDGLIVPTAPPPTHIRRFRSLRSKARNQSPYEKASASVLALSGSQLEIQHTTSVSVETCRNPSFKPKSSSSRSPQRFAPAATPRSAITSPIKLRSTVTSPTQPSILSPNYVHGYSHKQSYSYSVGLVPNPPAPSSPERQPRQEPTHKDRPFLNGLAAHPICLSSLQQSLGASSQPQQPTLPPSSPVPRSRSQTVPDSCRPSNPLYLQRQQNRRVRINKSTSDLNFPRESPLRTSPIRYTGVIGSEWKPRLDSKLLTPTPNQPRQVFKPCLAMYTMSSRTPANLTMSHEISPPSSPDLAPQMKAPHNPSGDISPMGSSDEMPSRDIQATPTDHTNIPAMRRERKTRALRAAGSRDQMRQPQSEVGRQVFRMAEGRDMRWDAMTGEPTLGPGRSAQVKPAEYAQGISRSPNSKSKTGPGRADGHPEPSNQIPMSKTRVPHTHTQKVTGLRSASQPTPIQTQMHHQEQEQQIQSRNIPLQTRPEVRPAWKGASGRTAILDPVRDNKTGVKARRNVSISGVVSPVRSETGGVVPVIRKMAPSKSKGQTTPVTSPKGQSSAQVVDYPTPPRTVERDPPQMQSHIPSPTQHQHSPSDSVFKAQIPPSRHISADLNSNKSIRRKPTPSTASINSAPRNPVPELSHESTCDDTPQPDWSQPASRFSVTTVATSIYSLSPEVNPVDVGEPLPEIPEAMKQLSEAAHIYPESTFQPSFSDKYCYDEEDNIPTRVDIHPVLTPPMSRDTPNKATPAKSPNQSIFTSINNPIPKSMATAQLFNSDTISIHTNGPGGKALPPAPPEASASDRVAHLSALLEALANRRININRSIAKMTEMMPRDNLLARPEVLKKREMEKLKVQALEDELAEVRREEYELGIKLHRARKRQDRDANFEGNSTLWVRRALE